MSLLALHLAPGLPLLRLPQWRLVPVPTVNWESMWKHPKEIVKPRANAAVTGGIEAFGSNHATVHCRRATFGQLVARPV
eukprot:6023315-Amphidinium_carterae.2